MVRWQPSLATWLRWIGAAAVAVSLFLPLERYPIFPQTAGQKEPWWYRYPLTGLDPKAARFYLVLFFFLWPALLAGIRSISKRSRRFIPVLEPLFLAVSLAGDFIFVGQPASGGYVGLVGFAAYASACIVSARRGLAS